MEWCGWERRERKGREKKEKGIQCTELRKRGSEGKRDRYMTITISARAEITLPSVVSDLLMLAPSCGVTRQKKKNTLNYVTMAYKSQ